MQVTRYSTPVYASQASFEERANLVDGQAVVRPTFATLYADTYTRGTDMTEQGYTEASETLTVNQTPAILLRADKWDVLQHKSNLQQRLANDGMRAINKHIDADYLAEVASATSTVDDGDVGGSAGTPITLDSTNIIQIFAAAQRKLQLQDVDIVGEKDPRPQAGNQKPGGASGFANLNPWVNEQLVYSLGTRETVDGDMTSRAAYKRTYFEFDNFVTTNGYWTGTLKMETNPTDTDTVVINGVTVTFVATLTGGDSEIHIASTVDITRANFVEWLNAGGANNEAEAVDTGYSAASASDQNLLRRITATNDNSNNEATFVAQGYGYIVVSETLTAAADVWSSEVSHQMFGQKGAVDMVLQAAVDVEVSDIPKQFGKYVKPRCLYGIKTFTEGANALVDVQINSSSWT